MYSRNNSSVWSEISCELGGQGKHEAAQWERDHENHAEELGIYSQGEKRLLMALTRGLNLSDFQSYCSGNTVDNELEGSKQEAGEPTKKVLEVTQVKSKVS